MKNWTFLLSSLPYNNVNVTFGKSSNHTKEVNRKTHASFYQINLLTTFIFRSGSDWTGFPFSTGLASYTEAIAGPCSFSPEASCADCDEKAIGILLSFWHFTEITHNITRKCRERRVLTYVYFTCTSCAKDKASWDVMHVNIKRNWLGP